MYMHVCQKYQEFTEGSNEYLLKLPHTKVKLRTGIICTHVRVCVHVLDPWK